jgi:F-type H+-transporting ATPase subunit a
VTSDTETAAKPGEAPRRRLSRRTAVLLVIAAVVVIDVLALLLVPPQNKEDPGGDYSFPADAIRGNIEPIVPHVIWDPTPETPPSTELVTFDVTITSSLFTMWIVMAIAIVVVVAATRRRREIPGPLQNIVEFVYEALSNFGISLGGPRAKGFIPLFASFFVFIILANWSGLVPPVGKIEALRAPTSDLNVTFGLALVSFFTFHVSGVRALGLGGYIGKYFSLREFRNGVAAGLISLFVGFMEFVLEFIKPITLAMRLFGNIYGGELALAVITSLTIAIIPVALIGLETFVGFVQALIFSTLTLIFTMLAIEGHHDEHAETHAVVEDTADGVVDPTPERLAPHGQAA